MTIAWPVPEDKKALKLSEVPESYSDAGERKTYLSAYNKFYGKCIAGKNSKPAKCAEGSHSAARSAVRKGRPGTKAGARNSAPDLKMIQDIHDNAFTLGAKCRGDDDEDAKALDLERQAFKVRNAWQARFAPHRDYPPDGEMEPIRYWVKAVFADFILIEDAGNSDLYKYAYTMDDAGEIIFAEPVKVEMAFVEAGKATKALDLERQAMSVREAWASYFEFEYHDNEPGQHPHYEPEKEEKEEDEHGFIMAKQTQIHPHFWPRAVFADFLLVEDLHSANLYKFGYSIGANGQYNFDQPVQVSMRVETSNMPGPPVIKTCWTCAIEGHEHKSPEAAQECINQTTLNTPAVRAEFVKSAYSDNSLKTIIKTADHLVVANYLVLFGGRDLEGVASTRVNGDGTKGEYFTKNTDFISQYTDTGQLLIDWEHRTQPDGVGPDSEDIFGFVDWKSAIVDEAGLFARRVLNRRNRYVKMLEALLDAGMIGSSTEPVQKGVVKGPDGEIQKWPLKRDSFSVSPMDPRMLSINHLDIVKALRKDPVGKDVYQMVFNTEAAKAQARALSLISQIGERS